MPFPNQFLGEKADQDIIKKLTTPEALSGTLNWALEGLKRLFENNGFKMKMGLEDIKEKYLFTSDPIAYFIDDCIEQGDGYAFAKEECYSAFCALCKTFKALTPSLKDFTKAMWAAGHVEIKPTIDGKQVRCWRDVKLVKGGTGEAGRVPTGDAVQGREGLGILQRDRGRDEPNWIKSARTDHGPA